MKLAYVFLLVVAVNMFLRGQVYDVPIEKRVLLAPTVPMTGLFSSSYIQVNGENDPITVKKPLYIIYNHKYCKLSVGNITTYFNVDPSYTRELKEGGYIEESFINSENETNPRGWYSILIQYQKNKTTITINLPMVKNGFAYIVDNAKRFSENGEVNGNLHVENWKEIEAKIRRRDSIAAIEYAIKQEKLRIQDSLYQVDFKKRTISQANNGDNNYDLYFRNPQEFELLKRKMKVLKDSLLKDNLMGYPIVVHIDTTGKIVECTAKANWYNYAMPKLNQYFLSNPYFVSPYKYIGNDVSRRGTKYPAYIEVQ